MTHSILTAEGLAATVYTSLSDFVDQEIVPALDGFDGDVDQLVAAMCARDMIVWEDGYSEALDRTYADAQGFRWSDDMIAEAMGDSRTFWATVAEFDL